MKWKADDVAKLKRLYPSSADEDLARLLGCTEGELRAKAEALALGKNKKAFKGQTKMPRWYADHVDYLRDNYPNKTNLQLAHELGRSVKSITSKAKTLGLRKNKDHVKRVCADNQKLRRHTKQFKEKEGR